MSRNNQPEDNRLKPLQAARIRRRLADSLYRLGPLPLGIIGALLISLLALLYLNELGLATAANQRLQQLAATQAQLQQENQSLREQQGMLQSPAYIEQRASQMGMVPEDPSTVHTIIIPDLLPDNSKRTAKLNERGFL
jgi:cell division protein FtsB